MRSNCGTGEDSWESFGLQETKSANPKGNQPWIFTDDEVEVPILWPPDMKSQLIGKDPDAGKYWRQEEKGTTEAKTAGWHHQLDERKFEQTLGDGDGQGSLACWSPRGCKEPDMTEQMNNNKLHTCCACEHQLPCTPSAARAPAIQAAAPLPQQVLQCSLGSRDYGRLTYRGGENHNCTPGAVWLRKRINNISRSCISCGLNPHDQLGKLFVYLSLSSVAQSCPARWPHRLQHIRLPCPSPTPRACSNSCPSNLWCHPTISSSVIPFSSCLQSFPASGSFLINQSFVSGGQSTGASALASVLPMNIQHWFPLGWTGLIILAVQGTLKSLLQHHSSKASILWCSAFLMVQLSHPYMTTRKTIALTRWTFVGKVMEMSILICCLGWS